jgi:site-specific DNA recombinase
VQNRKLVVNDDEARTVVDIFRRYLVLKSVHALREELASAGIRSKRRIRPDGAEYGGQKLSRGALYLMLQNRIYRGEITPDEVLRRDTGYHTCPLGAAIAAAARISFAAHRHSVVAAHRRVAAEGDNNTDLGP